ncbi:hypothetical protein P4668_26880 [Priestia megaterium]|uniref:hypothetical protein n=1 Tax=Priestia megaterium TaxID=1404 RepID=UPI002E1DA0F5|nr:hypothetical protein [Priestia megaterium]
MNEKRIKIKKLKPKLIKEIKELNSTRSDDINNFIINFITNVYRRHESIAFLRKEFEPTDSRNIQDSKVFKVAIGLYVSSLITCWETLFRDLFIFIASNDNEIQVRIRSFLKEQGIELGKLSGLEINEIEYMSKQFNFQDLEHTCEAFNFLLEREEIRITDYLNDVGDLPFVFSDLNHIVLWLKQGTDFTKKQIFNNLNHAFEIRHKVIHDANFIVELSWEDIDKFESCFITFPQFIMAWLATKYNQNRIIGYIVDGKPTMFLSNEELKKGWFIQIWSKKDFYSDYDVVK